MNQYMTSNAVMDVQRPMAPPPTSIVPPPQPQPPTSGSIPPTPESPQQSPAPEMPKPPRRKGPIIAIIVTVIVVLGLIAGAVFFYLSTRNKTDAPTTPTATETPIVDDGHVDPEDIDAAVQKIDGSLTNLNDSADFGADDLNDTTLGL